MVSERTIDSYVCRLDSVLYCFLSNPFTRTSLEDKFENIYNISINNYLKLNKYGKFSFILQSSLESFQFYSFEDFNYSFTSQKIHNESASVIIFHNGNSEEYHFIRENNIWKIIW